jgi:hypothetical protein
MPARHDLAHSLGSALVASGVVGFMRGLHLWECLLGPCESTFANSVCLRNSAIEVVATIAVWRQSRDCIVQACTWRCTRRQPRSFFQGSVQLYVVTTTDTGSCDPPSGWYKRLTSAGAHSSIALCRSISPTNALSLSITLSLSISLLLSSSLSLALSLALWQHFIYLILALLCCCCGVGGAPTALRPGDRSSGRRTCPVSHSSATGWWTRCTGEVPLQYRLCTATFELRRERC